jgi:hypothetical protein
MTEKESNNLINFNARSGKCVVKYTHSLPSRNLLQSVKMNVNIFNTHDSPFLYI